MPNGLLWEGIYFDLGVLYFKLSMYSDAANAWAAGLRLNPNDTDLLINMGAYCWMIGNKEQASKLYERALTFNLSLENARDNLKKYLKILK